MSGPVSLVDLRKMMDACPSIDGPKEFHGAEATIRDLARVVAASRIGPMEPVVVTEVYGFPVVVDERCPPGMLYFGKREDFEPKLKGWMAWPDIQVPPAPSAGVGKEE